MIVSEFEADEYEKAAGGLDYDEDAGGTRNTGTDDWTRRLQEEGPLSMLEDVEELLPEPVRTQVTNFPLTAVALGVGVGVFLGMRQSRTIISMITAAVGSSASKGLGSMFDK